jgi:2-octaprenyl-6-methoxyphenol hydroxylase
MNHDDLLPVLVAGAGPVGQIAALAMAERGLRVALVGPSPKERDRRTTALMQPSLALLAELGLSEKIEAIGTPLQRMQIIDATDRLIHSPTVTFSALEIDEPHFGLNLPNADLLNTLDEAVRASDLIERHEIAVTSWGFDTDRVRAHLADGRVLVAQLAIAADGRGSPAREAAGIDGTRRQLPQVALVLSFAHTRDHNFTSTEFHTPTGPFTQVPLSGKRSSLVWVERPERAEELAAIDDAELSLLIEEKMGSMLGRVTVEPGRQTYPLSEFRPRQYAQNRIALVGEAAHVFPPIGAQGMNLGIRDVRDLAESVMENVFDPGGDAVLAAYQRRRRLDVSMRSQAVNALNRSLLSDMLPAQMARSIGLEAMRRFTPLRAFAMREGLSPGAGFSALFPSRKKVWRQDA